MFCSLSFPVSLMNRLNETESAVFQLVDSLYFRRILLSDYLFIFLFFLILGFTARQDYLTHFEPSQSTDGAKTGDPRKTTWPPASRTWLVANMTRAGYNIPNKNKTVTLFDERFCRIGVICINRPYAHELGRRLSFSWQTCSVRFCIGEELQFFVWNMHILKWGAG